MTTIFKVVLKTFILAHTNSTAVNFIMLHIACFVPAVEWVDRKEGERNVKVKFDRSKKQINVSTTGNKAIRTIDLSMTTTITFWLSSDKGLKIILIKVPKEYDLVSTQFK